MINKIESGSADIIVANAITPSINMSSPSAGMVRYNINHLEVYDGYYWLAISSPAEVSLSYDAMDVIKWASKKIKEEAAMEKLKDNPAIADLLKQKADIEEKIKMVEILLRDNNGTN